jgi:hypothetical protein
MHHRISIRFDTHKLTATLTDTPCALAVWDALPLGGFATRWGDEVYFPIPVDVPLESTSREILEAGELGYWPTGNAFCIFFGPTPLSRGQEIRAASAVNVIGKMDGALTALLEVKHGTRICLEQAD